MDDGRRFILEVGWMGVILKKVRKVVRFASFRPPSKKLEISKQ